MTRCFLLLIAATTAAHAGHRSERWANAVTTDETIEKILHSDPLRHWWHGGYPG